MKYMNKKDETERTDSLNGSENPFLQFSEETNNSTDRKSRKKGRSGSAGTAPQGTEHAEKRKYIGILMAEIVIIAALSVILVLFAYELWFVPQAKKEPEIAESIAETTAVTPTPASEAEESEVQYWFPADHTSETSVDILLSRNDMLILPSGSVVREEQIDTLDLSQYFIAEDVTPESDIFRRISGKSIPEEMREDLPELSYLKVLYRNPDGAAAVGELICLKDEQEAVISLCRAFYENEITVSKMNLLESYWTENGSGKQALADSDAEENMTVCLTVPTGDGLAETGTEETGTEETGTEETGTEETESGETGTEENETEESAEIIGQNVSIIRTRIRFAPGQMPKEEDDAYRILTEHGFVKYTETDGNTYFVLTEGLE